MARGSGRRNEDWDCDEQVSYCFTLVAASLFICGGIGLAIYMAMTLWGDLDLANTLNAIGALTQIDVISLQLAIFIISIALVGIGVFGITMAVCAKLAANPDGKCDECEKCCTSVTTTVYLALLIGGCLASLVLAAVCTYYYTQLGAVDDVNCPYPEFSTQTFTNSEDDTNRPDAEDCAIDSVVWDGFFRTESSLVRSQKWIEVQDWSNTCGYYCGRDGVCDRQSAAGNSTFSTQLTGLYCSAGVETENPVTVYTPPNAFVAGEPTQQPYRPTFYAELAVLLLPLMIVWWVVFVTSCLLIASALAMCIREGTSKKKYTPQNDE